MNQTQVYSQAIPAPKVARPVDLSSNDWISPFEDTLTRNPQPTTSIYIGGPGDLMVAFGGAPHTPVPIIGPAPGFALTVGIVQIFKEGTTATGIIAFY